MSNYFMGSVDNHDHNDPELSEEFIKICEINSIKVTESLQFFGCLICKKNVNEKKRMKHFLELHKYDSTFDNVYGEFTRRHYNCSACNVEFRKSDCIKAIGDHIKKFSHVKKFAQYRSQLENLNQSSEKTNTESNTESDTVSYVNVDEYLSELHEKNEKQFNENFIFISETVEAIFCGTCEKIIGKEGCQDVEKHSSLHSENLLKVTTNLYFCDPCNLSDIGFIESAISHLKTKKHRNNLKQNQKLLQKLSRKNNKLTKISDESTSKSNFSKIVSNKNKLKEFLNEKYDLCNELKCIRKMVPIRIALKIAIGKQYPDAQIYFYGTRFMGLGCFNSTVNIFIDTSGQSYNTWPIESNDQIISKIVITKELLIKNAPKFWKSFTTSTQYSSPVLNVKFNDHQWDYVLTFSNGMDHTKTNLISAFFEKQPMCQVVTIFLMQVLIDNELHDIFDVYFIFILVLFYMQIKEEFPSIEILQKNELCLKRIGPWQVNGPEGILLIKNKLNKSLNWDKIFESIKNCLDFYINEVDYENEIICPLYGAKIQKNDINSADSQKFCKDLDNFDTNSAICVQDVFELNCNIASKINLEMLNKFLNSLKSTRQQIEW